MDTGNEEWRRPHPVGGLRRRRGLPQRDLRLDGHPPAQKWPFLLDGDLAFQGVTRTVEPRGQFTGMSRDDFGLFRAGFHGGAEGRRTASGVDTKKMPMDDGGMVVGARVAMEIDAEFIYDPQGCSLDD
ncbi:YceI family protein [Nocardiopsis rhodophaea]|uniref:YceI family protein n=1 Tax=Nocardiopsis rhodophaea TaxID=280238 RepID=UPI0031D35B92